MPKKKTKPKKHYHARDEYGLTLKEREFADLYRSGPDEVRGSAKRCYKKIHPRCKDSTAETNGPAILRKTQVSGYLQTKAKKAMEVADLTQERVLLEIMRVGLSDPRNLFRDDGSLKNPEEWDDDTAAAIASIEVTEEFEGKGEDRTQIGFTKKVRSWDKGKHLEMLAKYYKLLTEKIDLGGTIKTELPIDMSTLNKKDRDDLRRIIGKSIS